MDGGSSEESEAQFAAYVEALSVVLGGVDRQQPMDDYCLELLMPIERKSVEPMAAVTRPAQVEPALAKRVAELVLPAIERGAVPLRTRFLPAALAICHSWRLPTQRRRQSDPNGISSTM
jgi:SRSO17 transposase